MSAITIRAMTPDERRALTAARLLAVTHAPYFAHALFAIQPLAAEGLGTAAVDKGWRLYVDPQTMAEWGPATFAGVLVHEIGHLVRDHAGRAEALRVGSAHARWNFACDAALNDDLIGAGIPLPDGVVTPAGLGLPDNGIEESYFAALADAGDDDGSADGDGADDGCGSGAGNPAAAWELPAADPTSPALGDAHARTVRRTVAHAIREHAASQPGTVPAGLRRWATDTIAGPTVAWQRVLGSAVRRAIAYRAGAVDYTYNRPGRRRIPHVITPAMRRPVVTVAVVIDTSGSMAPAQIAAALGEVRGVVRAAGVHGRGLAVLTCDAAVGAVSRVRRVQDVTMIGGGGTDMRIGITAAENLTPRPDAIVVLTDGYTPWPDRPTRARLIIGLIGVTDTGTCPTWAQVVVIPTSG